MSSSQIRWSTSSCVCSIPLREAELDRTGVSKTVFSKAVGGVDCFGLVSAIRSNTARHICTSGALLTTSSTKGIVDLMSKSLEPALDPRLNRSARRRVLRSICQRRTRAAGRVCKVPIRSRTRSSIYILRKGCRQQHEMIQRNLDALEMIQASDEKQLILL